LVELIHRGYLILTPYLSVDSIFKALELYRFAFGSKGTYGHFTQDGKHSLRKN
jgi:hypothetical protein